MEELQEYAKKIARWMLSASKNCAEKKAKNLKKVFEEVKLLNKN